MKGCHFSSWDLRTMEIIVKLFFHTPRQAFSSQYNELFHPAFYLKGLRKNINKWPSCIIEGRFICFVCLFVKQYEQKQLIHRFFFCVVFFFFFFLPGAVKHLWTHISGKSHQDAKIRSSKNEPPSSLGWTASRFQSHLQNELLFSSKKTHVLWRRDSNDWVVPQIPGRKHGIAANDKHLLWWSWLRQLPSVELRSVWSISQTEISWEWQEKRHTCACQFNRT